jgi:hypothetical protein
VYLYNHSANLCGGAEILVWDTQVFSIPPDFLTQSIELYQNLRKKLLSSYPSFYRKNKFMASK